MEQVESQQAIARNQGIEMVVLDINSPVQPTLNKNTSETISFFPQTSSKGKGCIGKKKVWETSQKYGSIMQQLKWITQ